MRGPTPGCGSPDEPPGDLFNMPKTLEKPIELLAPAGSPGCALAAFDAGADAVYAGLAKFNARERGENFTFELMRQIIDYAHRNGKKLYLTLNTLIKERELPEVAELLAQVDEMRPDGLLVQDLGVLRMVRNYFPALEIHASTQMGIHNSAGLALAARLGVKRVVLERQVTLEELEKMDVPPGLELECFIHGALCCSLSGSCFFSSWLGGMSGNRGKCKQPCRRRYFSSQGNGFFFSPRDLCGIDVIDRLRDLGVSSLKIEGRLKQPDYVSNTVKAYRLLLDTPAADRAKVVGEARQLLSKGCGRHWSDGFYRQKEFSTLIRHDGSGASGSRCGSVEHTDERGFGFTTGKRLFIGDRLRVQPPDGGDGPALTMTRFFVDNAPARRALPGQRVFVCCDKPVSPRGTVFKIGESPADYSARIAALPPCRARLELALTVNADGFTGEILNAPVAETWRYPLALAAAQKHPLDEAVLKKEFAASDSKTLELGSLSARIGGSFFLPAAELKAARRSFWEFAHARIASPAMVIGGSGAALERFRKDYLAIVRHAPLDGHLPETVYLKPHGDEPGSRKALRAALVYDINKETQEAVLPDFTPESGLDALRRAVDNAYHSGIRSFRVTSLYGLEVLKKHPGIRIVTSQPLPVCNSLAVLELMDFGVGRVMAHIELEKNAVLELDGHSPLPLELYRLGRPALLTTRAEIPVEGALRDARGNEFEVRRDGKSRLTRVYPKQVMSLPRLPGIYDFYDLTNATWRTADPASFNFDAELG